MFFFLNVLIIACIHSHIDLNFQCENTFMDCVILGNQKLWKRSSNVSTG